MPYSQRDLILARLAFVRDELNKVLVRIDDAMLDWAPAKGMRTIGGQLVEIAGTEMQLLAVLKGEPQLSWEEAQTRIGDSASLANLRRQLEAARTDSLAYLASLSDEGLDEPSGVSAHWHETIGLADAPIGEVLRGLAQHEAYHTGQLVSYLWARGDDPYAW